ncbi:heptahelical transmembrane protein 4-like isoform X2 [Primulina huaijiensis]|uniref:heptahelical transmembrane protein 4-like isoform X2 n=1 Tax=Primulina huaijiensis TaxID=1492673 RepID=UPI003CC76F45
MDKNRSDRELKSCCESNDNEMISSLSKEGKGKRLWKKVKYQLVEYHSLPGYLKDNEYILGHYRSEWPMKQALLSVFTIHNETLNVWTMKDDVANIVAPLMSRPITRWPFFAFMCGAMFCLLASSACHLLCCHSERLSYIMLRFDYAGISALISTSFYPLVYYSFMCYPLFCNLYIGFITVLGIGTILVSLLPVFQSIEYRNFRTMLFVGMSLSGAAPILHKLILFWNQPEAVHTTIYEVLMGTFYGIGALIYATRVPERWMPGKFDIAGHSHQLFHIMVVAGAYTHYRAGLVYLRWRDLEGC